MIFISYAREDVEFATWLASSLEGSKFDIWIDQLDIPAGVPFDDAIEAALEKADHVVVILTPSSILNANVRNEGVFALDKGKVVIPVLFQTRELPIWARRLQYVDFTEGKEKALARLSSALREKPLSRPATEAPAAGWFEEFFRATIVLLAACIGVVILVGLIFMGVAALREGKALTGILWLAVALGLGWPGFLFAQFLARSLSAKPKARVST